MLVGRCHGLRQSAGCLHQLQNARPEFLRAVVLEKVISAAIGRFPLTILGLILARDFWKFQIGQAGLRRRLPSEGSHPLLTMHSPTLASAKSHSIGRTTNTLSDACSEFNPQNQMQHCSAENLRGRSRHSSL